MKQTRIQVHIRFFSLLLAVIALAGGLTVPADALASDDYTLWRQGDPEWNEAPAWSGGWSSFIQSSGCWVTSISMLLRHYGVETGDVNDFNPWIFCNELAAAGGITGSGDMRLSVIETVYPEFAYAGEYSYSHETLKELFDEGYACAVLINGGGHMVAVKNVTEDDAEIMDPASDKTLLSECSGVTTIYCFGPFEDGPADVDDETVALSAATASLEPV